MLLKLLIFIVYLALPIIAESLSYTCKFNQNDFKLGKTNEGLD